VGGSKKQTIGYRIFLGVHAVLTHGPIDKITRLQFDKKTAWEGDCAKGSIVVSAENLFGGDKKEGGVSGVVDFLPGEPTQKRNAYLQGQLGEAIPAYRGVASLVYRGGQGSVSTNTEGDAFTDFFSRIHQLKVSITSSSFYWGMNPYLKNVSARLVRIHTTTDGATQWYDEKAEVPPCSDTEIRPFWLTAGDGASSYSTVIYRAKSTFDGWEPVTGTTKTGSFTAMKSVYDMLFCGKAVVMQHFHAIGRDDAHDVITNLEPNATVPSPQTILYTLNAGLKKDFNDSLVAYGPGMITTDGGLTLQAMAQPVGIFSRNELQAVVRTGSRRWLGNGFSSAVVGGTHWCYTDEEVPTTWIYAGNLPGIGGSSYAGSYPSTLDASPTAVVAVGDGSNAVYRTGNTGLAFSIVQNLTGGQQPSIVKWLVDGHWVISTFDQFDVTGVGDRIWYSDDDGYSWNESTGSTVIAAGSHLSISFAKGILFIGAENYSTHVTKLWKSLDYGRTFTEITLPANFLSAVGEAGFEAMPLITYAPPPGHSGDMNPAHIIRECLVNPDWGMGYQELDIDDVSFAAAADTLYDEQMGISILWDKQMTIEEFVGEIIRHITAALYVSRDTGLFTLKLIRDDYDVDTIPVLDEDDIDKIDDYQYKAFGEGVNSVTVNFWDKSVNSTGSITEQDTALVQMQLAVIGTTIQYPGFTNVCIASRVALRDVNVLSTPLRSCTIYADRDGKDLNIGGVVAVNWSDYSPDPIIFRIMGLALGDGKSNKVRLTVIQDVFSLSDAGTTSAPPTIPPASTVPVPVINQYIDEAPYYELVQRQPQAVVDATLESAPQTGFLLATAERPSAPSINAELWADAGSGYSESDGTVDFCPSATLDHSVRHLDTVFVVTPGADFDQIEIGMYGEIDYELIGIVDKSPTTLTVRRGMFDTNPNPHSAGTKILIFSDHNAVSSTEYVEGETVSGKILPVTTSATLDIGDATAVDVYMYSRAWRPYLPGNFRVNGVFYAYQGPIPGTDNALWEWSHRDRKLQVGGDFVDYEDGNIGPEAGQTYDLYFYGEGLTILRTITGLTSDSYEYTEQDEKVDSAIPYEYAGYGWDYGNDYGIASRRNGFLNWYFNTVRDGVDTWWGQLGGSITRQGYGFRYGYFYGGYNLGDYGWGNNYGNFYGGVP
jgi:hypothetical protein